MSGRISRWETKQKEVYYGLNGKVNCNYLAGDRYLISSSVLITNTVYSQEVNYKEREQSRNEKENILEGIKCLLGHVKH